jgi:hypothetical protein
MNAEVAELLLSAVWLQNNTTTEQLTRKYTAESEAMNRQIREINKARQGLQTKAYPELSKLVHKRNLALQRKWSCQLAHEQIKQDLLGKTATLFGACFDGCVCRSCVVSVARSARITSQRYILRREVIVAHVHALSGFVQPEASMRSRSLLSGGPRRLWRWTLTTLRTTAPCASTRP